MIKHLAARREKIAEASLLAKERGKLASALLAAEDEWLELSSDMEGG